MDERFKEAMNNSIMVLVFFSAFCAVFAIVLWQFGFFNTIEKESSISCPVAFTCKNLTNMTGSGCTPLQPYDDNGECAWKLVKQEET